MRVAIIGAGGVGGRVVFEVGKEHVFKLLEVDVGAVAAGDVEWRGGVWMWDVLAGEEGDVAVGAVHVLLYCAYAKVSDSSDAVYFKEEAEE